MDGWTDNALKSWTLDRLSDEQIHEWMNRWMVSLMDQKSNRWITLEGWIDCWVDSGRDGRRNLCIDGSSDYWMDGRMDR